MADIRPGPRNALTDVTGLLVGNAENAQLRSGTTVVVPSEGRVTAAVDVRGGAPGTRETDALAPGRLVTAVDAVVLSGGSAFGLDAAGSVTGRLARLGRGYHTGDTMVPIVPSAILFDLANGGDKDCDLEIPYRALGVEALDAVGSDFAIGKAGAGYGARAGSVEGGLGTASCFDPETGITIGALVAVNCFGETFTPDGRFYAAPFEMKDEFGGLGPSRVTASREPALPKLQNGRTFQRGDETQLERMNTTIAVVGTDATLSHVDTCRFVVMAQAGLARAVRPVYTPFDGDTVFALSTGQGTEVDLVGLTRLGALAADCLARAVARGVYEATAFDDACPSWHDRYGQQG